LHGICATLPIEYRLFWGHREPATKKKLRMRNNQPVTQREFDVPANVTLMSTTDTKGRIVYANAAFVAVSGFEPGELIGQPHNLVRHPDMPREAFADMWTTLKKGRSWTALVKNRRKNGDHYWVRANATPVVRDGRVAGYMSVRTQPAREEIAAAEALYRPFREGRPGGRRFFQGLIVRTGPLAWLSLGQTLSTRWRVSLPVLGLGLLAIAGALLAGLSGAALAAFALGAVLASVGVALFLRAQISAPLEQVLAQALRVAAGQPGENVNLDRVDEIGMILRAINQAGLNLRSLVDDVSDQVGGVQNASCEIAQGNSDLSARTEKTSANLSETAASMDRMTSTVKTNADTARQAAALANDASDSAAEGGQVVGGVVGTMHSISAANHRIADIVGVIDSIAFQTNILALNAAVEAAGAGAHGRGFAVVASEVRSLAQRSATAAREIKSLVENCVDQVASGAAQVDRAGSAMNRIVAQVQRVNALIAEISTATADQSGGISRVNQAVSHLDQATQQNAALVLQTSAAAESMRSRAARLAQAVSVFKSQSPLAAERVRGGDAGDAGLAGLAVGLAASGVAAAV
jgi:aerotaxis receptor